MSQSNRSSGDATCRPRLEVVLTRDGEGVDLKTIESLQSKQDAGEQLTADERAALQQWAAHTEPLQRVGERAKKWFALYRRDYEAVKRLPPRQRRRLRHAQVRHLGRMLPLVAPVRLGTQSLARPRGTGRRPGVRRAVIRTHGRGGDSGEDGPEGPWPSRAATKPRHVRHAIASLLDELAS